MRRSSVKEWLSHSGDHTVVDINEVIFCGFERMVEPFGVGFMEPQGVLNDLLKIWEFKPINQS